MASDKQIPPVLWAQRTSCIYLTIDVPDCENPDIKVEPEKVSFSGKAGPDQKVYEIVIEFYKPIVPETTIIKKRGRGVEFYLPKKEEGPFWPHLLKTKEKQHWLKIDFSKWVDEDEEEDEDAGAAGGPNFEEMLKGMGGMPKPSLEGLEDDSDEEEMPDLED